MHHWCESQVRGNLVSEVFLRTALSASQLVCRIRFPLLPLMSGYLVAVTEHFGSASPQSLTSFRVRMCDFGFVFMPVSVSPRVPSQPSDVICNRDLRWSSLSRTHTISYHTHPNTGKRTGLVAKIHLLYAQQKVTMMRGPGPCSEHVK